MTCDNTHERPDKWRCGPGDCQSGHTRVGSRAKWKDWIQKRKDCNQRSKEGLDGRERLFMRKKEKMDQEKLLLSYLQSMKVCSKKLRKTKMLMNQI